MNDVVKEGYNRAAGRYLENRDQFKNSKYLDELINRLKKGRRVLDLGCGSGRPVDEYLIKKGYKVLGLDISESQISLAKEKIAGGEFEVKDMSDLKRGEYQVDAVVSFYAIFHIKRESHLELFNKINSYLPVGGWMLITMGATEWEGEEDNFHGVKMYWSHYGAEKNAALVEQAGFELVINEIDTSGNEKHQVILARKEK